MVDRLPEQTETDLAYLDDQKNGDRMIKQLLNSVTTKIVICQCLADQFFGSAFLRQIFDLLVTHKSRYFLLNLAQ